MEQTLTWSKPKNLTEVESRGVLAGEENGNKIYVGRNVDKDGNFVPSKLVPSLKKSFFSHHEKEDSAEVGDYLANPEDYHWVNGNSANLDEAALIGDSYIGRALYDGHIVVGRVDIDSDQLIGTFEGNTLWLPSYDLLIYKAKGVVYEAIQKASNASTTNQFLTDFAFSRKIVSNGVNGNIEEPRFDQNYLNLTNKIRQLEMEKLSYRADKESYEQRLEFEQRKVADLSQVLKKLKVENARFAKERINFEEKYATEQTKYYALESKVESYIHNNNFLMKKVNGLEEAIQIEKLLVESMSEKFGSSQTYSKSIQTKVFNYEETIKTQQQRIFELESDIMISTSNSESLIKKVSDYEENIRQLRIQIEIVIKKLQLSRTDNDFLVQKLSMLTQTLRTYQSQIECLTNKLQSSKTVIASAHADLSRANAQIAKYQAALSSCYTLNGELMTKVSGMGTVTQNLVTSDCSMNLINYPTDFGYQKSFGYGKTSSLLDSDVYLSFMHSEEGQSNGGSKAEEFTPYGVATNGFTETETKL